MTTHLGQGAYGDVFRAKRKHNGSEIACTSPWANWDWFWPVKVLSKQKVIKHGVESVKNEKEALVRTNHPFIVKLHYSFQSQSHLFMGLQLGHNGMVLEPSLLKSLGELLKFLKTGMNQQCCTFVAAELLVALEYLHKEIGIIHRLSSPNWWLTIILEISNLKIFYLPKTGTSSWLILGLVFTYHQNNLVINVPIRHYQTNRSQWPELVLWEPSCTWPLSLSRTQNLVLHPTCGHLGPSSFIWWLAGIPFDSSTDSFN